MRRAAAAGAAVLRVAVVGVAVPADPAKRRAGVVLARLGPLGEPRDRAPAAARARVEVDGEAERVLAVQLVALDRVAGADLHVVAPDQVEHVAQDAPVHARPGLPGIGTKRPPPVIGRRRADRPGGP